MPRRQFYVLVFVIPQMLGENKLIREMAEDGARRVCDQRGAILDLSSLTEIEREPFVYVDSTDGEGNPTIMNVSQRFNPTRDPDVYHVKFEGYAETDS